MKKYLKKNIFYFIVCVILFSTAGIMSVFLASIVQKMVDTSVDRNIVQFYHVMILAILFIVINFLIYILRGVFRAKYLKSVMFSLNHDLFKGIFSKTVKEFNQENSSAYLSIFNNDLKIIEKNYFDNLLTITADLSQFIICLIAVFSLQFSLAVIVIIINIIAIFVPILFSKALSKKQVTSTQKYSQLNIKIKDFFNSFELIKCFQVTHHIIHQFDYFENEYETSMQNYRYDEGLISGFSTLSSLGVSIMTALISLYFVIMNKISIGEMLAITQLVNNISNPLGRLSNELPLLKSIKPIENKIEEYLEINSENRMNSIDSIDDISFNHVSFSYDSSKEIIHDFNYTFLKNRKYVLIGNSGSGKSTLIKLLLNNYEASRGTLFINGIDINTISNKSIYQCISIVHQNAPILNDTLKNNITYFESYSEKQINEVVERAGLKNFVQSLPNGLDTVINENGNNISGGEKQRISIARALLKNADLLIYDEPTSNLDHKTAKEIENILLKENRTCIMITHKLDEELLSKFDVILVLKDGFLEEIGSYQQLIKEGDFFRKLVEAKD
ncbi:MAG: ABC transporter ATP-binding protein [Bacillota bacterium]|nr:ABC transporter ATP-binding protein [Bacillota bacterium]